MKIAAAVILSLALMLISLGHTGPVYLFNFLNADSMYFHALYNDLVVDGAPLWGWDLNTTFNLLPSAVLYLPTLLIVNHPVICQIVHGLLQYGLFLWGAWYMLGGLQPRITRAAMATAMLLPAWFFLNAMKQADYFLAAQFFHPYHFGTLIMGCFLLGLNMRWMRGTEKNRVLRLAGIFVLVVLSSFSNRIFMLIFVLPWLFSLAVLAILQRDRLRIMGINAGVHLAGMLGGIWIFEVIRNMEGLTFAGTQLFAWHNVGSSLNALFSTYGQLLQGTMLLSGIIIFSMMIYLIMLILFLAHIAQHHTTKTMGPNLPPDTFHFLVFTLFLAPMVFFAPALAGMFFDLPSIRYNFMIFVWMLLGTAPLMQLLWRGKPWQQIPHQSIFVTLLLVTLMAGWALSRKGNPGQGLQQMVQHYPQRAQCVDQAALQYDLKNGVGNYWDGKPVTAFSRQGIKVRQVHHNLSPYYLAITRNWFYPYSVDTPRPVFNFIINDPALDAEVILRTFGQNIDTLNMEHCTIFLVPDFIYHEDYTLEVIGNKD